MITLFRKLFWTALFSVFTLGFVTFFDHGYNSTKQFTTDAKSEFSDFVSLVKSARPTAKGAEQKK